METIQIEITSKNLAAVRAYVDTLEDGEAKAELSQKILICELKQTMLDRETELANFKAELKELEK